MSQESDLDLTFAQRLLDAGRAEPLPSARTAGALAAFSAAQAALHAGQVVASPNALVPRSFWARIGAPAGWVAVGALAGSAATFAWLQSQSVVPPPATSFSAVTPSPRPSASVAAPEQPAEPALRVPLLENAEARVKNAEPRASGSLRRARMPADLAAEVASLDAIRTAVAIGAWAEVESQLVRYRRDFPNGVLRNEAEVLAISSMVAQGHEQAAASAGKAFLAKHPRDPQAAHVRDLIE